MNGQWHQTVAQEQEWREEHEQALLAERANQAIAEMRASQDDQFRKELEAKYPQIKAVWPGRTK